MLSIGIVGDSEKYGTVNFLKSVFVAKGWRLLEAKGNPISVGTYDVLGRECFDTDIFLLSLADSMSLFHLKGIRFDVIVFLNCKENTGQEGKHLHRILKEKNVVILNSDCRNIFPFYVSAGTVLITCGVNSKASVTTSSILSENGSKVIQCCIQRTMRTLSGKELEPQEFPVETAIGCEDVTGILAGVAAAIEADIQVSDLNTMFVLN